MNQISVVLTTDQYNEISWVFELTKYWINPKGNTYVLYGLPLEIQFDLDKSRLTTYNSQLG